MKKAKVAIILNFDKDFFEWGKTNLQSLSLNAPEAEIILFTVNINSKLRKELHAIHGNTHIYNCWIPFLTKKFKRHYMINRKPDIFLKAIRTTDAEYYLLLDADMILNKEINLLIDECRDKATGIVYRDYESGYHMKLNASLVLINKPKHGINLITEWLKVMNSNLLLKTIDDKLTLIDILRNRKGTYKPPVRVRKGSWFWDQLTLYYALKQSKINYQNLPINIYLNSTFDPNAVLWSAHSGDKNIALRNFKKRVETLKTQKENSSLIK